MNKKILRKRFTNKIDDILEYLESNEAFEYFIDCMERSSLKQRAFWMWRYFNESVVNLLIEESQTEEYEEEI